MITELQSETWIRLCAMRARLPHALLLHGAAGSGKLALAERFAQALLCEADRSQSAPCGSCAACRWFLAGSHPDVRYVEPEAIARQAASAEDDEAPAVKPVKPSREIKIDQIRALADFINLGSHRGGARIAILHPAEDMNAAAANALLKSLEEPPPGTVFLLVSHRPWRLPPTVRSRCIAVAVPLPEPEAACAWLAAQGVANADRWLAFAGGSPRRALELATGEHCEALEAVIRAPEAADLHSAFRVESRETLELLADALQKYALDRAFHALAGRRKYFPAAGGGAERAPAGARDWLSFARRVGELRLLVRHPLNPRLVAAEMLAALPGSKKNGR
jgi:DNA polymerase-3 subunit delta'